MLLFIFYLEGWGVQFIEVCTWPSPLNPLESMWGRLWPALHWWHVSSISLSLPRDCDNSLGLQLSMSTQILSPTVCQRFGYFPFSRAQCSSLWERTGGIIPGYTCYGVAGSSLVGIHRLCLHSVHSRAEDRTRKHGFLLKKLPSFFLSSVLDFFWWYKLSGVLVGCSSILPPGTLCSINHLCSSADQWPSDLATYYNNYILLASDNEVSPCDPSSTV